MPVNPRVLTQTDALNVDELVGRGQTAAQQLATSKAAHDTAVAAIPGQVDAALTPAVTASNSAAAYALSLSGIPLKFRSAAIPAGPPPYVPVYPAAPTSDDLVATPGDILGVRTNELGRQQPIVWNRTTGAWNDYGLPLADAPSVAAATNTANAAKGAVNATKTGLALLNATAGVQVVDGSTWEPFGTAPAVVDAGQHVQGTGGAWWYRKTEGRVANRLWYPKPNPQDDTSALVGALSVRRTGETLQLPPGDTYLKGSLDMSTFRGGLAGADASSRILCSGLPDYQAYITTRSMPARKNRTLQSLRIEGPGGMSDGNPGTNKSVGIKVADSDTFEDVSVSGFLYGWNVDCEYGHITWNNCTTAQNYYGVHNTRDGYDNLHIGGLIHGNFFADLTCAWNTSISGMMIRVHLGGAPITFYQFAAPAGTPTGPGVTGLFLVDLTLQSCRFEGCGRAAIYSENPFAHSTNINFEDVGYALTTQASSLAVALGRDTGVPVQLGYLTGDNRIDMSGSAFGQAAGARAGGLRGAISVESLYGPLAVRFSSNGSLAEQQIRIAGGAVNLLEIQGHLFNNTYGRLEVQAGSGYEVIDTGLYVPADAAWPILNAQQPLVNLRSETVNDAGGQLRIIVQHDAAPAFSIIRWRLN